MRRILIADDSSTIRSVVEHALAGRQIEVLAAPDGPRALDVVRQMQPDLVLCDILMPGMTGYDVAQAVSENPVTTHIPVLLLTGAFEPFDEARARRSGAVGSIAKPFDVSALVERIERELSRPRPAQRPPAPEPVRDEPLAVDRSSERHQIAPPDEPLAFEEEELTAPVDPFEDENPTAPVPPEALAEEPAARPRPVPVEQPPVEAVERRPPEPAPPRAPAPEEERPPAADRPAVARSRPEPVEGEPREGMDPMRAAIHRAIEELAPDVVREVAWEVVPEIVERVLRELRGRDTEAGDGGGKSR
jgi:CheY-like chemotaxis protein